MDKHIFEARKEPQDPSILFGKKGAKYGLNLQEVYTLEKESDGDIHNLNQLYFNVGFAAGRCYERDEHHVATNIKEVVSQRHMDIQVITSHFSGIGGAKGMSYRGGNDCYTILINADISEEEQAKAFLHEMFHIWNHDFDSKESVQQIEERAHSVIE